MRYGCLQQRCSFARAGRPSTVSVAAAAARAAPAARRPRKTAAPEPDAAPAAPEPDLLTTLMVECGLTSATARRVAEAADQYSGVSSSGRVLAGKVATLQRVLGRAAANKALHTFPQLLSCRCDGGRGRRPRVRLSSPRRTAGPPANQQSPLSPSRLAISTSHHTLQPPTTKPPQGGAPRGQAPNVGGRICLRPAAAAAPPPPRQPTAAGSSGRVGRPGAL
jgi:hypothetical protein